jgi:hypothetical protein
LLYALFVAEALAYQPDLSATGVVQPAVVFNAVKTTVALTLLSAVVLAMVQALLLSATGRPLPRIRRAAARTFLAVLSIPLVLTVMTMSALKIGVAEAAPQYLLLAAVVAVRAVIHANIPSLAAEHGAA